MIKKNILLLSRIAFLPTGSAHAWSHLDTRLSLVLWVRAEHQGVREAPEAAGAGARTETGPWIVNRVSSRCEQPAVSGDQSQDQILIRAAAAVRPEPEYFYLLQKLTHFNNQKRKPGLGKRLEPEPVKRAFYCHCTLWLVIGWTKSEFWTKQCYEKVRQILKNLSEGK